MRGCLHSVDGWAGYYRRRELDTKTSWGQTAFVNDCFHASSASPVVLVVLFLGNKCSTCLGGGFGGGSSGGIDSEQLVIESPAHDTGDTMESGGMPVYCGCGMCAVSARGARCANLAYHRSVRCCRHSGGLWEDEVMPDGVGAQVPPPRGCWGRKGWNGIVRFLTSHCDVSDKQGYDAPFRHAMSYAPPSYPPVAVSPALSRRVPFPEPPCPFFPAAFSSAASPDHWRGPPPERLTNPELRGRQASRSCLRSSKIA